MADLCEVTDHIRAVHEEWIADENLSPEVAAIARKYPPWKLFRMKDTGHRVTTLAFSDDGTMRVSIGGRYNFVMFERSVFGIKPSDLEECDLPDEDEAVGVVIDNEKDLAQYLSDVRDNKSPSEVVQPLVEKYYARIKASN